ncbi:7060_t:CDS:2, partial [Gigaspora rosea]
RGLKKGNFSNICELAVHYYQNLHHNDKECHELVYQLIKYKAVVAPWNLEYSSNLTPALWWEVVEDKHMHLQELAKTMFAITPSQTNSLQDLVDLSDPIFGASNKEEITLMDEKETTMEFDNYKDILALSYCEDILAQSKWQMQQIENHYNELKNQLRNLQNAKKEFAKLQPYKVQREWVKDFFEQESLPGYQQRKYAKRASLLDDKNLKLAACTWLCSILLKDHFPLALKKELETNIFSKSLRSS